MIDLTGRVCVITGAAEGIGAELAAGFARRGAKVVACDIAAPRGEGAALSLAWDVRDSDRAAQVMDETVTKLGKVDCFIANAAIMPRVPWNEITPEGWRDMMAVNLDGAWFGAQAAARAMAGIRYGKIVLVSSIEFEMGPAAHIHYTASKAAILGMTRTLARSLGPSGVRVNCIMPGAIQTASEIRMFPDQAAVARFCAERQSIPDRMTPRDIEPSFAFLCCSESDAMTGQVLCVDHGFVHY